MIERAATKLRHDGWTIVETTGFIHLIGPLWERKVDESHEFALVAQDKHQNRRGMVQGGVMMTFADRTCGMMARYASGRQFMATVQLDTHFVEAGKIGDILISRPRVVRSTRSLSRDSRLDQRKLRALLVQGVDGMVDRTIERISVGEGLVCEMV